MCPYVYMYIFTQSFTLTFVQDTCSSGVAFLCTRITILLLIADLLVAFNIKIVFNILTVYLSGTKIRMLTSANATSATGHSSEPNISVFPSSQPIFPRLMWRLTFPADAFLNNVSAFQSRITTCETLFLFSHFLISNVLEKWREISISKRITRFPWIILLISSWI
jgi:hypothetical protein